MDRRWNFGVINAKDFVNSRRWQAEACSIYQISQSAG
jgi:hypothetical protein